MREYYLKAMGIVSWKKRMSLQPLQHFSGVADDGRWLLLADASTNQQFELSLLQSIASLLGISSFVTEEHSVKEPFTNSVAESVLILGANVREMLSLDEDAVSWMGKDCLMGPALSDLLLYPQKKALLWQSLKPRLWEGVPSCH